MPQRDANKALASLYKWHAEYRQRAKNQPDMYRLTSSQAATWARWICGLADRCDWSIDKTTMHALGEWFDMRGKDWCLFHARHPLAMLFTQEARDLGIIEHKVLEKRLAYQDEDFETAPPATPDLDAIANNAGELLARVASARAVGGR